MGVELEVVVLYLSRSVDTSVEKYSSRVEVLIQLFNSSKNEKVQTLTCTQSKKALWWTFLPAIFMQT